MRQSLAHNRGVGRASLAGNDRKAGKEQYYTPKSTAHRLVEIVSTLVPDFTRRTFIEPAAGTGAFVDALAPFKASVIAVDVEPRTAAVVEADFFSYPLPLSLTNAVAITNPPFGRNSSLSVPFFNKLADHCEYICFVVPRSWRKWSLHKRLDSRFHLIYDEALAIDYEDEVGNVVGGKGELQTVFQVWQRRQALREAVTVPACGLFEKASPAEADVSLTIFGRGCGKYKTNFAPVKNTTQMFLRVLNPLAYEALDHADFAQFYNNVAFVEALSWDEINFAVNEWLSRREV